jgi:hypothetical protein
MIAMTIYTYEMDNGHIETKLEQVLQNCMIFAGVTINLKIKSVPKMLGETIQKWTKDQDLVKLVSDNLKDDYFRDRVLIATDKESLLSQFCREKLPHAEWGYSYQGYVSIDYAPQKFRLFSQLHECLHFFGVDDCYEAGTGHEPKAKANCDTADCVMRYGSKSVKICRRVVSELKKYSENGR